MVLAFSVVNRQLIATPLNGGPYKCSSCEFQLKEWTPTITTDQRAVCTDCLALIENGERHT